MLTTTLHKYEFDLRTPNGNDAWRAFKAERENGPRCFGPVFHSMQDAYSLDGAELVLDTKHLFDNQWDAIAAGEKAYRVFDWFLQAHGANYTPPGGAPSYIRRGYYLDQTAEMRETRRNTHTCGYCGKQEPAAKGNVFCPHCIDSEYLTEKDLPLTRMLPIEDSNTQRMPLTDAERAHLIPIFRQAQIHGVAERGKIRIKKARADNEAEYVRAMRNAKAKHDAVEWCLARGISPSNMIYYPHTSEVCFGWRKPLSAGELNVLLDTISEFPFPYKIKCDDGRTIDSGHTRTRLF